MKKNGFTLIELIVVVTIIALLSLVAIVNYGGSSKKSRDARRMADMEKIRIALEMYRQENGIYPVDAGNTASITTYLPVWPADPTSYKYDYNQTTSYTYTLLGHMEDLGSTNRSATNGCAASGNSCNYIITNP